MNQYVVVVVPPEEIIKKVDVYRKKYAKNTSYVIDPHFTIYPPFTIISDTENDIVDALRGGVKGVEPKNVRFSNVGYFEGKNNVAFFESDVESTNYLRELLVKVTKSLEGKVKNVYDDYNFTPGKFRPHMTIAEKIPADNFVEIKKELGELEEKGEFVVSSIYLYKQEPETNLWQNCAKISFG